MKNPIRNCLLFYTVFICCSEGAFAKEWGRLQGTQQGHISPGLSFPSTIGTNEVFSYKINQTWDSQVPLDGAAIEVNFYLQEITPRGIIVEVSAPYYNDPPAPSAPTDDPFPGLWDYEVVELFFLGNDSEYLEIELGPRGHYLLLYLAGERNDTGRTLPLRDYRTLVLNNGTYWVGQALIPACYFPQNVTRFNAYAIHKSDADRRYMSLFPVNQGEFPDPDFHRLDRFGDILFDQEINDEKDCNIFSNAPSPSLFFLPTISIILPLFTIYIH